MQYTLNQTITPPISGARLREFDALRGFSMFLVVFTHVFIGFDLTGSKTVLNAILGFVRMPLFFFVSGFFAYRAVAIWNKSLLKRVLQQKFKAQIFCTVVFFALLSYTRNVDIFRWIHTGFGGYWFTIVLFQMFLIYVSGIILSKLVRRDVTLPFMIIITVGLLSTFYFHLFDHIHLWTVLNCSNLCQFLQFFVLGLLCRKYKNTFLRFISDNKAKAILIAGFTVLTCASFNPAVLSHDAINKILGIFILPYFGLLLLISLFHSSKDFFDKSGTVQNTLCLIGRRTLDIYMLHYFFLPSIPSLHDFLAPNNMIIMQIGIGLLIASMIISVCLLLSTCLRSSSITAEWLFGVKRKAA